MIEADQVFVKGCKSEQVVAALKTILLEEKFYFSEDPLPLPTRYTTSDRKQFRHFYVAHPFQEWVCILESRGGDEGLAQRLSLFLQGTSIWISYSERVEDLSLVVYSSGAIAESRRIENEAGDAQLSRPRSVVALQSVGEEFYKRWALPWPFYSYEQIDRSPNKDEYFKHFNFKRA
jgi:hypothetical protein